jgi:hypothetical protein
MHAIAGTESAKRKQAAIVQAFAHFIERATFFHVQCDDRQ